MAPTVFVKGRDAFGTLDPIWKKKVCLMQIEPNNGT